MDETTLNPPCAKCGQPVPQGAGFCPKCGTPTLLASDSAIASARTALGVPTGLPTAATGLPQTVATPRPSVADAVTFDPAAAVTNLNSPSPKPTRLGDGPFQAGQQVGPRYTILKLLGVGGMGAVYQAFDHELGVAVAIKVIRPAAQSSQPLPFAQRVRHLK